MGSVRKIGYITLGVALVFIGLAYLLRDTAVGFLWNAPLLGALILITLGIEVIAMKVVADRTPGVIVRGSGFSIVLIVLILVSLFFTSVFSNLFPNIQRIASRAAQSGNVGVWVGGTRYNGLWTYNMNPGSYNERNASIDLDAGVITDNSLRIDAWAADIEIVQSTTEEFRVEAKFFVHRNYGKSDAEIIADLVSASGDKLVINENIDDRVYIGSVKLYVPQSLNEIEMLDSGAVRLTADGFKGDMTINSAVGDIELRRIGGDVDISQSAANVTLEDIGGSVTSSGGLSLGDLKVYNVGADMDITLNAGNAVVRGVNGDVNCKLDMGNLELRDVSGEISADASMGNITIYGNCAGIVATVNMGNLEWRNFDTDNVKIDAVARFGSITSSRSMGNTVRQTTSERLTASFGDESIVADLTADMGNVTIYP